MKAKAIVQTFTAYLTKGQKGSTEKGMRDVDRMFTLLSRWRVHKPLLVGFVGLSIFNTMTVNRGMPTSKLVLHSPRALEPTLMRAK